MITIYSKSGAVRAKVRPSDASRQVKRASADDYVSLTFTHREKVDFEIGDYFDLYGERYKLNTEVTNTRRNALREFVYEVKFEAKKYDLVDVNFEDAGGNESFSYTATPRGFMELVILNANRLEEGWTLGTVQEGPTKTIIFENQNTLNALSTIAVEFGIEFNFSGKRLSFTNAVQSTGIQLSYGKDNGLYSITRKGRGNQIATYVRVYGGTRNLPAGYRDNSGGNAVPRLRPPVGNEWLTMNVEKYGRKEGRLYYEDIIPEFKGEVDNYTAGGGDTFTVVCSDMIFDLNSYLKPGITARVGFLTGNLTGYEFEVSSYTHATKTFTLKKNTSETAYQGGVPNANLYPGEGDEYTLYDIELPSEYVSDAEDRLLAAALADLPSVSSPGYSYEVEVDPLAAGRKGYNFSIGDTVRVVDSDMLLNADIRIMKYERDVNDGRKWSLELSERSFLDEMRMINRAASLERSVNLQKITIKALSNKISQV